MIYIINGKVYTMNGKTLFFYGKTVRFVFFYIFINMSVNVAKEKMKGLTARLEKSLYKLKYGDMPITMMNDELYEKVKCICKDSDLDFPLIKICDDIFVDCDTTKVFCTLSKLADDHGIILDPKKTTK
jgi:hypothetical protein